MVISSERREHRTVVEPAPRRPSSEDTSGLRLERRAGGQLVAARGGQTQTVKVCRCFPWSEPGRFVSLRDSEEEEFALVTDPSDLDEDSRQALEAALVEAGFVLEIEVIHNVEEEIEIRCWQVRTAQGERAFQTPRDEWPREVPGGGLLIRDVAGDLFCIRDPDALDRDSQRHLWAFID
ncbi:MAG: DUF1854 domain-containing protein [Deltaproteobacteria bacterium]|nr:DUF1854 domain-containing protein [Deltaproteobacteria bacterium]